MTDNSSPQTILVPIDFSPYSETSLLKACELASCMKLSIVVLHVVHDPSEMPGYYARMAKKKHMVRMADIAKEMMDEFMSALINKHPAIDCLKQVETMLVVGVPANRILEVADKVNAQMIVMGSQGHTGLAHLMLGSKAEQVVRLSPISVTIIKAHKDN